MSKISELGSITGANTRTEDLFVIVNLVQGDDGTKNITRRELVQAIQYEIFNRITITGGSISGVQMFDSRLNNVIIVNSDMEDSNIIRTDFNDGTLRNSTGENLDITDSKFDDGEITDSTFADGEISDSTADNVDITNSTFDSGEITDSTADNIEITNSTFEDGDITDSTADNIEITNSTFEDGDIADSTADNIEITNSTFEDGDIADSTADNVDITNSTFESGIISDSTADNIDITNSTFDDGELTNSTANNITITQSTISDSEFGSGDIFDSTANNVTITNSDFSDGTGNNNIFTNTTIDESLIQNSDLVDSTFTGSMNNVIAENMTITSSAASGLSQTQSSFDSGGITQSTFDGGIISNSDLVDFDMDLSQKFDPPLDEESYFAIKNAKTGETEQISYKQLFDEVSKSTEAALKVHVDAGSGDDANPGTQLQPVLTLERAFELAQEKAGGLVDRNALNNAVHITVGPGTYYTKGNLALPDDCSITSTAGQYATVIEALPGFENNNAILVGSGCYMQGFSFMNWKIDNFDFPEGGFAVAYRPGAKLLRSPYLRDSTQLSNFVRSDIEPPLNPQNSKGTLDDLGREFTLVAGHTGTFAVNDEITFTSGAKAFVSYVADLPTERKIYVRNLKNNKGFAVGDTVVAESGGVGVIESIGIDDFPNRLVGRGGGCVLADRRVLDPDSLYTYVLCFGFTPRSQNGIGYVARDGAGINGIGSLSIFVRTAFYALNGGQMTLNNSGTQFGDISMRSKGATDFFVPKSTNATLIGNTAFADTINENRNVIIEDMVEYLTSNTANGGLGYVGYDADKCQRDARIIIDGLGYDIALDSNYWGRLAGITYRSPISYVVPGEQLEETLGANQYLQSRVEDIFAGKTEIIDRANTSMQELYNVLQFGEENINPITWVPTTVARTAARELLQDNRSLIQDEVINWIEDNDEFFAYNSAKCRRDTTDYILPAVKFDMLLDTNYNTVTAGNAYYMATAAKVLGNQKDETIGAYKRLKGQTNNLIDSSSFVGKRRVDAGFDRIIDIIDNGQITEIEFSDDPAIPVDKRNARKQLQANRDFIQDLVMGYIDNNYFIYDSTKCRRDVTDYILPGAQRDIVTGSNFNAIQSGIAYRQGTAQSTIENELVQTLGAITELKQLVANNIITDNTSEHLSNESFKKLLSIVENDVKVFTPTDVSYDPVTGVAVFTIGTHSLEVGDSIEIKPHSITFECGTPAQEISHPRFGDPAYKTPVKITAVTATTITANVGDAGGYTEPHTFVRAEKDAINGDPILWTDPSSYLAYYTPTDATYDPVTGESVILLTDHDIVAGDFVELLPYSLTFTCSMDGDTTEHSYPRKGDGNYRVPVEVISANATSITVNVGVGAGGAHTFVSASDNAVAKVTINSKGQKAREELQANRATIQQEVMTFLDSQYFVFDGEKCSRDTGLILDAVRRDVASGSNYHSVFAGLSYQLGSGSINVVVGEQLTETVSAIEFLKDSIAVELTGPALSRSNAAFDEIIDILNNGTANADPISFGTNSLSPAHTDARIALQLNKDFIQAEVVAYIAENYPALTYDVAKCSRDTGFLIDAISWDVQHGSNAASVNFARMYYDNAMKVLPKGQVIPTIRTWEHIAGVVYQIVRGKTVTPTTGNTETQDQSIGDVGIVVGNSAKANVRIVTNAIKSNTLNWLPAYIEPTIESGFDVAVSRIAGRTESLQDTVIKHIRDNFNGLPFNKAKCQRDIGLIIDAVCKDIEYGGNASTIEAARFYFSRDDQLTADYEQLRSINVLPLEVLGQLRDTAREYDTANVSGLRTLINILPEEQRIPTRRAFLHLADVAEQVIIDGVNDVATSNRVRDLIQTIANLVDERSADTIPEPVNPTVDPNRTVARKLIQRNKDFIAEDVILFLKDRYFTFDGDKCSRDIASIVNAVKRDQLTNSNFNAVFNGLAYRSGTTGTNTVIQEQLLETVKAVEYARDEAVAAVTDIFAKDRVTAAFNEIIDIMAFGTGNADPITFGTVSARGVNGINAREHLQNNKDFLKAELTAYIADNYPSLTYDVAKCERDVGYLIDSATFDIMHGGNSAVRNNAKLYFENAVSVLPESQQAETADAFNHLANCAELVVQSIDISTQGLKSPSNAETQNFAAGSAGAPAGAEVKVLINVVADAISNNDLDSMPALVEPFVNSYPQNFQTAFTELENVIQSIQSGVFAHLAQFFNILPYNEDKCRRDMGYVLDAISHDIQYGGNATTLNAAYMYFANASNVLPIEQRIASREAFQRLADVVEQVVLRQEVPTRLLDKFGVSTATYDPITGVAVITTFAPHTLNVGDFVMLREESLTFECDSPPVQISHPRKTDPAFKTPLEVTAVTSNTFTINVGNAGGYTGAHTFVSALSNPVLKVANPFRQDMSRVSGNPRIADHSKALAEIIANVVDTNTPKFPIRIDPLQTWQPSNIVDSKELVERQVLNLADSVLDYISDVHNGLSFPQDRCRRDIGYLIDAISHDVQYDGNYATRIATQIYFENGVSVLPADTRTQTADIYNYLGTVFEAVVQGDTSIANTVYTDTPQDTSETPATATEAARAATLISYVEDAIRADSLAGLPRPEQPNTSWVNSGLLDAAKQIKDNLKVLANDLIDFINTEYNALDYNRAKCHRDVGYLVDAFSYDLNYGGNIASRWNADFYFWNNQYRVPEDQRVATAKSYRQLGRICKDIVLGRYPGQVAKGELATKVESDKVESLANIFYLTQINKDTKFLPVREEPEYIGSGEEFVNAQFILGENKLDLAADTVRFVNAEYGFINLPLTKRDASNLLQCIINDFRYEDGSAGVVGSQNATRTFAAGFFDWQGRHVFPVFNPATPGLKYQNTVAALPDLASITGQKPNHAYIVANDFATNFFEGDIYYWNGSTWVLDGPNNTKLLDAFAGSWDRMRSFIVDNLSPDSTHSLMVEGLFNDCLKDNVLRPNKLRFGSLVESIAHQFNGASAGVNRNALPLNFKNLGAAISARASVLAEDGGRVRWSGSDELNNQFFARGLLINGRTGRIEGRPFTSSVRKLARRASNSRAVI